MSDPSNSLREDYQTAGIVQHNLFENVLDANVRSAVGDGQGHLASLAASSQPAVQREIAADGLDILECLEDVAAQDMTAGT